MIMKLLSTPSRSSLVLRSLLVLGACASPAAAQDSELVNALEPRPAGLARQNSHELDLWNDAAFRAHFVRSYAADLAIEPPLTFDERDVIIEMREWMAKDRPDRAIRLLERNIDEDASAALDFALANIVFQLANASALDEATDQDIAAHEAQCATYMEQALAGYQTCVAKHRDFRRAHKNLGLIHVQANRFDKAIPHLSRVVELGGGDALNFGLLGYAHASNGDHLSAETAYRMASLLDPAQPDWKKGLAFSLLEQRRYPDAAALCDVLIRQQPQATSLWKLQANAFLGMQQPLRAAENFEFVARMGQAGPQVLAKLGDIYSSEALYDLARDAYVRGLRVAGDQGPDASIRAAKVLISRRATIQGRDVLDAIEGAFRETMNKDQQKEVLRLRARIALANGQGTEEEASILREILALDPRDGDALVLLGKYHDSKGEVDLAAHQFEYAASLEAFEFEANREHGQMLVRAKRYKDALPKLRRAQELKPSERLEEYLAEVERLSRSR
tara:strand:- start:8053 stop:9564 length:1512 start_codon:yes stop_codon:yes gene_type:complete